MAVAGETREFAIGVGDARVGDYIALLKPRVMSLVVFTALVGLLIAPGSIHPLLAATAILAIAVGAGAAGALNMWFDADIDALMSRTASRPIPRGRVSRGEALGFGLLLSVFSVATLALVVNWTAAGLLAFTIFFYVVVYTMWLKRLTPQNIVIGGAAGAYPPMIGWVAVTGTVSVEAWLMFAIIFLWTPPHFWALALFKEADYAAAGVPMLPNVAGERATRNQILIYSVLLALCGLAPVLVGMAGALYGIAAALLGAIFVFIAVRLWAAPEEGMRAQARRLFSFSMVYLFAVFLALLADRMAPLLSAGSA
ncbi:MAG TPA: heme o synthase [Devosiaceae bacterium]|nr:heme o synthase [Devosiaceae bacterium]